MTTLSIILSLILLTVIIVQVGKIKELATSIRGEEAVQNQENRTTGLLLLGFMVVFLVATIWSFFYYTPYMLGYGHNEASSAHGGEIDSMFNTTLIITGIVFVITHIALFWFSYKYIAEKGRPALFMPHDNRLEVIWTLIPAVAMTFLVIGGLQVWNNVMADVEPGEEYIEIEATGIQFAWLLRYPGADGLLGERNYRKIDGINPLGQVWKDERNHDDTHPSEIVLPIDKKVRVRIIARDVLHNFYLPQFRVKMDAIPGMPTYFVFTPTKTTAQRRKELSEVEEWQVPADPDEPTGPKKWETFEYELACAELCGTGHFSMRRVVRIVSEEEYNKWLSEQKSYYSENIKGTESDTYLTQNTGFGKIDKKEEVSFEDAKIKENN